MRLILIPFCFVWAFVSVMFELAGFNGVSCWLNVAGVRLFGKWDR